MKVCIVGKYPPIEGGVSTQTYWLARGLAERGHDIHVVSNANEVEKDYRIELRADDCEWYQPIFESGGRVLVYNPQTFARRSMGHIPRSNPYVTKLASVATDVIRSAQCDVILSYYLEPYALSGYLASTWTHRPLIVKHAGSDIDRLFMVPDCATTYSEILRAARYVITQPALVSRFLSLGIHGEKIRSDMGHALPLRIFNPEAQALQFDGQDRSLLSDELGARFDSALPTLGVYGKYGEAKGTFDLVEALGLLKAEGLKFNFLAMIGRQAEQSLQPHLSRAGILEDTFVLPYLPNWRVPQFIRSCTAICFLERQFPVAVHGPIIPREVLATGTCLVLSGEIARKQRFFQDLDPGRNVLIVDDPRNVHHLAATIKGAIENPSNTHSIGLRGHDLASQFGSYDDYITLWERLLATTLSGSPAAVIDLPGDLNPIAHLLDEGFLSILRDHYPALPSVPSGADDRNHPFDTAIRWTSTAVSIVQQHAESESRSIILEALRYQGARLEIGRPTSEKRRAPFDGPDCLLDAPVGLSTVGTLCPCSINHYFIETFDYDVTALFCGDANENVERLPDLRQIARRETSVLFTRFPNMRLAEFKIGLSTSTLLALCSGDRTTLEVLDALRSRASDPDQTGGGDADQQILAALQQLHRLNLLIFLQRNNRNDVVGGLRN